MEAVDAINRGEPPASPTYIVQPSLGSDNRSPPPPPAPAQGADFRRHAERAALLGPFPRAQASLCARAMKVDLFDFDLPPERIALRPVRPRDAARMLVVRGKDAPFEDAGVRDLPALLDPGDVLVFNDTA